jgi:hypothetical protein
MPNNEFIRVDYDRRRRVVIDGSSNGFTNETITVSRGPHRVTLGVPVNYEPAFRKPTVTGTTPGNPMPLEFTRTGE